MFRLPRGYRVVIYTHCTFSGCVDVAFQLLCNQGMRVFLYLPHCHGQDTGVDYVPHISADLVPATAGFHKLLEEEHPPSSPMGGVLGSCAQLKQPPRHSVGAQTDRSSSNGAEAETGAAVTALTMKWALRLMVTAHPAVPLGLLYMHRLQRWYTSVCLDHRRHKWGLVCWCVVCALVFANVSLS